MSEKHNKKNIPQNFFCLFSLLTDNGKQVLVWKGVGVKFLVWLERLRVNVELCQLLKRSSDRKKKKKKKGLEPDYKLPTVPKG